jgi:hypothetical protein
LGEHRRHETDGIKLEIALAIGLLACEIWFGG